MEGNKKQKINTLSVLNGGIDMQLSLTDEQIIHIGDYCTGFMVSERCTGSKTGSADWRYDRDKYEYSSKSVNGIKNISYSEITSSLPVHSVAPSLSK